MSNPSTHTAEIKLLIKVNKIKPKLSVLTKTKNNRGWEMLPMLEA